jgi:hypothetical protein
VVDHSAVETGRLDTALRPTTALFAYFGALCSKKGSIGHHFYGLSKDVDVDDVQTHRLLQTHGVAKLAPCLSIRRNTSGIVLLKGAGPERFVVLASILGFHTHNKNILQ